MLANIPDPVTGEVRIIDYRNREPLVAPPVRARPGFFLGDGAGVGKGRQLAALIAEQYEHNRRRHLWLSISSDLIVDARRDLRDVGKGKLPLLNLADEPYDEKRGINFGDGVLFATYSTLISRSRSKNDGVSRLDQIIQWLAEETPLKSVREKGRVYAVMKEKEVRLAPGGDKKRNTGYKSQYKREIETVHEASKYMSEFDGCILFDEAHKAKNLYSSGGTPTRTGLAVEELQRRLPHARVVYCSATGVTDPNHVGYMMRMNLWGEGQAFRDFDHFRESMGQVSMMELVAIHMKRRGRYLARSLSFQDCTFDIIQDSISPDGIKMYNLSAVLWQDLLELIQEQFVGERHNYIIGADKADVPEDEDSDIELDEDGDKPLVIPFKLRKNPAAFVRGQYWAAHQRFFRSLR